MGFEQSGMELVLKDGFSAVGRRYAQAVGQINRVDFYTSHEALHLPYEQAQTRQVPRQWGWFNLGTHFPWIGMRTASMGDAHVEYMRGIRNPIGLKVGPTVEPQALVDLIYTAPSTPPVSLTDAILPL